MFSFNILQTQQQVTSASFRRAAATYLTADNQLVVSVVLNGKTDFAVAVE
jgi:predicted Zn-dependent peptidase